MGTIDGWLNFRISKKPATLVKHLRSQMESLLLKKIVSPNIDVTGSPEGKALIQAISTLVQKETKELPNEESSFDVGKSHIGSVSNGLGNQGRDKWIRKSRS